MAEDAAKIASAYFDAWKINDFDTMRSLVDDDITFFGPLAQLEVHRSTWRGSRVCRGSHQRSSSARPS